MCDWMWWAVGVGGLGLLALVGGRVVRRRFRRGATRSRRSSEPWALRYPFPILLAGAIGAGGAFTIAYRSITGADKDRVDVGIKASFFLRDVALRYGLAPEADRWLLQPVDVWVRRFVKILEPGLGISDDRGVADWVARNFTFPELANAGLWYFGARIAPRRLDYTKVLTDAAYAEAQVQRHVEGMEAAVRAWKSRRND